MQTKFTILYQQIVEETYLYKCRGNPAMGGDSLYRIFPFGERLEHSHFLGKKVPHGGTTLRHHI